jgi:UDP-N-acetylmuramate--alanine ligase
MNLADLKKSQLHFVGIGGSGMSGLARIAIAMGIQTSGSDAKSSQTLETLTTLGAKTFIGHDKSHIQAGQIVVTSSAIADSNPEVIAAKELGLPILSRAQTLALFMEGKKSIAVAGTHGKTTTTSMLTVAFQNAGLDPSFAIGGTINRGGTNAHYGSGEFFIAEADESDGSFLAYRPYGAIITNIELDHVDNFPNLAAIMDLFEDFVNSIQPNGFLVAGIDSPGVVELLKKTTRTDLNLITYGGKTGDLTYSRTSFMPTGSFCKVAHKGKILGELELAVPGEHNIQNALAAIGAGLASKVAVQSLMSGLTSFTGARRRFEIKGVAKKITVIDDYGHHPTEITATLAAAKNFAGSGKVIVVFQPHRYSRTAAFASEFSKSLLVADQVYLLEVYSAGENPIPGVSSKTIADKVPGSIYNPSMVEVAAAVAQSAKPGDVIITLGAGDVSTLAPVILDSINAL